MRRQGLQELIPANQAGRPPFGVDHGKDKAIGFLNEPLVHFLACRIRAAGLNLIRYRTQVALGDFSYETLHGAHVVSRVE